MTIPLELEEAETIMMLCRTFHVLPSAVRREPAGVLRLVLLEALAHGE